jgi:allantoicase
MLGGTQAPSQHHAWVNPAKARYCHVHLDLDLLGGSTLFKVWGGLGPQRRETQHTGRASSDNGIEQIREITKHRAQRGCRSIDCS